MERLPHNYVRCVDCGHVYNQDFHYDKVPYSKKPNLMFNRGVRWRDHLDHVCDRILERLGDTPVVVEIGCGDGHLLRALADRRPNGRYLGFDANACITHAGGAVEAHPYYFEPAQHLSEHKPDLIVTRHLLEHLTNPAGFLQEIAFCASWSRLDTLLFVEVPCIDRVFATRRTADFFYEHASHFTTESFTRLFQRTAKDVELVERGYDDEVIFGLVRLGADTERVERARTALDFYDEARGQDASLQCDLEALAKAVDGIAIWGGTGKGAAFINRCRLSYDDFPIVVDSDLDKVGTHVPGTGQPIQSPELLVEQPVSVIVIATQWRAGDIVLEIEHRGIPYDRILLAHDGVMVDYFLDEHPYRVGGHHHRKRGVAEDEARRVSGTSSG